MSYRTINYIVTAAGISPDSVQDGGIQGESNALNVTFDVSAITLSANDFLRIEVTDGCGGFNSSEHLTVSDGTVTFPVPAYITEKGGVAVLHLVITTISDNEEIIRYSFPARICFAESGVGCTDQTQLHKSLSGLTVECQKYADEAANSKTNAAQSESNSLAYKQQCSDIVAGAQNQIATANAAQMQSFYNNVAASLEGLNAGITANSARIETVNTQNVAYTDLAKTDAISAALNNSASLDNTLKNEIYSNTANALCKKVHSGKSVLRCEDVVSNNANMSITIHGKTVSESNVSNPKISIYGKNLLDKSNFITMQNNLNSTITYVTNADDSLTFTVAENQTAWCQLRFKEWQTKHILQPGRYRPYTDNNYVKLNVWVKSLDNQRIYQLLGGVELTEPCYIESYLYNFASNCPAGTYTVYPLLESGNITTAYEPFKAPQEKILTGATLSEGQSTTVYDLIAAAPTSTIMVSDENNIVSEIDVQYNRDAALVIDRLENQTNNLMAAVAALS